MALKLAAHMKDQWEEDHGFPNMNSPLPKSGNQTTDKSPVHILRRHHSPCVHCSLPPTNLKQPPTPSNINMKNHDPGFSSFKDFQEHCNTDPSLHKSIDFNRNVVDEFQTAPQKTCTTEAGSCNCREVDTAELEASIVKATGHCKKTSPTPFCTKFNHCPDDHPNLGNNPSPPPALPKSVNALPPQAQRHFQEKKPPSTCEIGPGGHDGLQDPSSTHESLRSQVLLQSLYQSLLW